MIISWCLVAPGEGISWQAHPCQAESWNPTFLVLNAIAATMLPLEILKTNDFVWGTNRKECTTRSAHTSIRIFGIDLVFDCVIL